MAEAPPPLSVRAVTFTLNSFYAWSHPACAGGMMLLTCALDCVQVGRGWRAQQRLPQLWREISGQTQLEAEAPATAAKPTVMIDDGFLTRVFTSDHQAANLPACWWSTAQRKLWSERLCTSVNVLLDVNSCVIERHAILTPSTLSHFSCFCHVPCCDPVKRDERSDGRHDQTPANPRPRTATHHHSTAGRYPGSATTAQRYQPPSQNKEGAQAHKARETTPIEGPHSRALPAMDRRAADDEDPIIYARGRSPPRPKPPEEAR